MFRILYIDFTDYSSDSFFLVICSIKGLSHSKFSSMNFTTFLKSSHRFNISMSWRTGQISFKSIWFKEICLFWFYTNLFFGGSYGWTALHSCLFCFCFCKKTSNFATDCAHMVIALCSHTKIRCTVTEKSQPEGTFSGSHSREENINTT